MGRTASHTANQVANSLVGALALFGLIGLPGQHVNRFSNDLGLRLSSLLLASRSITRSVFMSTRTLLTCLPLTVVQQECTTPLWTAQILVARTFTRLSRWLTSGMAVREGIEMEPSSFDLHLDADRAKARA